MTESQLHTKKQLSDFLLSLLFPRVGGESRGEQVLFSMTSFVGALLFAGAEAVFGTCPFGISYLAAVRNRVFLSYAGAVLGILLFGGVTAPVYIFLYTAVLLIRFLLSTPRKGGRILPDCYAYFHEEPALRVAVSAVFGFTASAYQLLVGGLSLPSILYAVLTVVEVPLFAFLFLAFFEADITLSEIIGRRKMNLDERLSRYGKYAFVYFLFSALSIGAVTVYALSPYRLFGFSFANLLAACLTLYASNRKDALVGAFAGLCLVAPTDILLSPAFLVLGFTAGLLWRFSSLYALGASVILSSVLLAVTGGLSGFLGGAPEILLAAVLFWPLFSGLQKRGKNAAVLPGDTTVYYNQNSDLLHMKRLSTAFENLSGTFESMASYMRRPDKRELEALCRRVMKAHCSICDRRDMCVHTGVSPMNSSLTKLSDRLAAGGRDLMGVFNEAETRDCLSIGSVLTDILSEYAREKEEKERNSTGDLLSADYAMLSRVLSDAAERDAEERAEDKRLSADLTAALESHGGFRGNVTVFGKRQKQILVSGNYWEGERLSVDEIRALFEQLCCCRLSEPTFDFSGGQMTVETHTERRFDSDFITATLAGGGEMSGDVTRSFDNAEGYSYKLLSDGMGSGKTASMTASLTGAYLSELLQSGASPDTALKMLNQVIRQKGCECSATIDLLELDLIYGKASFIKSGAATSYVRRGNDVFRIRSKTMPIGLLKSIDAEKINFDLCDGDVIVMLSDGVSQVPEDAPWLLSLLTEGWDSNLPTMADKIIEAARAEGRADDMTVGLCRIGDRRERKAG